MYRFPQPHLATVAQCDRCVRQMDVSNGLGRCLGGAADVPGCHIDIASSRMGLFLTEPTSRIKASRTSLQYWSASNSIRQSACIANDGSTS